MFSETVSFDHWKLYCNVYMTGYNELRAEASRCTDHIVEGFRKIGFIRQAVIRAKVNDKSDQKTRTFREISTSKMYINFEKRRGEVFKCREDVRAQILQAVEGTP